MKMERTATAKLLAQKVRVHLNDRQAGWVKDNCIARRLAYNFAIEQFQRRLMTYEGCMEEADANAPSKFHSRIDGAVQPAFVDFKKVPFPSYQTISKAWPRFRDSRYPWMKERKLDMDAISVSAFYSGYRLALNGWKQAGYRPDKRPTFQGRGRDLSITFRGRTIEKTGATAFDLPRGMGSVRIGCPLRVTGEIRSVTLSLASNGKWYAAFLLDATGMPDPAPAPDGTAIGVDVGVKQFIATSDGDLMPPAMDFDREHAKLARMQRALSRMQGPVRSQRKASKNWLKQSARVNRQSFKIACKRHHYIELATKRLASENQIVAIENLKVANMTKSAKGTAEAPGANVAAKSGLNRAILQGGFGMFRTRLEAKVAARNGEVRAVNPAYTSQTCNACGHVAKENRPDQATFKCVACGHEDHADTNAAKNILFRALTGVEPVEPSPSDDVKGPDHQGTSTPASLPTEPVAALAQEAVAQDAPSRTPLCEGVANYLDSQRLAIRRRKRVNVVNQLDFFFASTA